LRCFFTSLAKARRCCFEEPAQTRFFGESWCKTSFKDLPSKDGEANDETLTRHADDDGGDSDKCVEVGWDTEEDEDDDEDDDHNDDDDDDDDVVVDDVANSKGARDDDVAVVGEGVVVVVVVFPSVVGEFSDDGDNNEKNTLSKLNIIMLDNLSQENKAGQNQLVVSKSESIIAWWLAFFSSCFYFLVPSFFLSIIYFPEVFRFFVFFRFSGLFIFQLFERRLR
jgi:hypothetical protein